jgi:glycosyltransferase involved in cell wall biosynthesis
MIGAGILKVASDKNIPVIFTPTDFWWFCPQGRLQLPDDSVCAGPSGVGGNCLRHFTSIAIGRRSKIAGDLLYKVPATFWNTLTIVSKTPLVNILPFGNNASALASRPSELDHLKCHIHRILAPTELIQSAMLRVGFAPEIIHLLPYGVDPIERTNKSSDTITVGFIGSISPHKGAHVLLEALSQLPPHIHFKTTIYGDTTYNSKYSAHLHALADASGKDVEFRGKFNEREIGQVLSDLDILVIPSTWAENRPLTLLAALDARVPIIVSDMPGMTCEVTDGENGMVVPAGDPVALAGSLMRLLEDTNLRERLSNSSLRPIRFDKYIDVLEGEYRSLCRGAHSNSAFNDWGGAPTTSDKGWNTIVESQSAANYRFREI